MPAVPEESMIFSSGERSVSTAEGPPRSPTIRNSASTVPWSPSTPSSETSTIRPGNTDSTE